VTIGRPLGGAGLGGGGNLSRALSEEESDSVLQSVLRFLGRPGFVVRSLLMGEPGDALENVAQTAMDLPTFGFLNRDLSLANLLPESLDSGTGDITTRKERPEASDVTRNLGFGKLHGGEKVAVDVIGGILTDPLTYLTFGGGSVPRAALKALAPAAAKGRLAASMAKTAGGKAAIGKLTGKAAARRAEEVLVDSVPESMFDDLFEAVRSDRIAKQIEKQPEWLRENLRAFPDQTELLANSDELRSLGLIGQSKYDELQKIAQEVDAEAALVSGAGREDVASAVWEGALSGQTKKTGKNVISGYEEQADIMEAGVKALESSGKIYRNDAVRVSNWVPGFGGKQIPGMINFWGRTGRLTALRPFLSKPGQAPEGFLQQAAAEGWAWARGTLFDKYGLGRVPSGLREIARRHGFQRGRDDYKAGEIMHDLFRPFSREERETMGKVWQKAQDEYLELARTSGGDPSRFSLGLYDAAVEDIVLKIGKRAQVEKTLSGLLTSMQKVQRELVEEGIWPKAIENPFYITLQAGDDIAEHMAKGVHHDGFRVALQDVFTKRRDYRTLDEFKEKIQEVARLHKVETAPEELVQSDMGELFFRRMSAHNRTLERWRTTKEAHKRLDVRPGNASDRYVEAVLRPLGKRGLVEKFMGGGVFRLKIPGTAALRELPPGTLPETVPFRPGPGRPPSAAPAAVRGVPEFPAIQMDDFSFYRGERASPKKLGDLGKALNVRRANAYQLLGDPKAGFGDAASALERAHVSMVGEFGEGIFDSNMGRALGALAKAAKAKGLDSWNAKRLAVFARSLKAARNLARKNPQKFQRAWRLEHADLEKYAAYAADEGGGFWASTDPGVAAKYAMQGEAFPKSVA